MRVPRDPFERSTVDDLAIGDERSFRHVALYADLKEVLRRARYPFRVLPRRPTPRADRALLLNLTFWAADAGGDVLVDRRIEADVVTHAAWHHLAARALAARGKRPSATALLLGEAIASAFDVYLVGRLLGHAPRSTFLASQVPAMAEVTAAAGLSSRGFERLLRELAAEPERAFVDLRELLSDASSALLACTTCEEAYVAMAALDGHRFAPLLPRYELSNWVLYAHAYGGRGVDRRAREVDLALRRHPSPLAWLVERWVEPALVPSGRSPVRTSAPLRGRLRRGRS